MDETRPSMVIVKLGTQDTKKQKQDLLPFRLLQVKCKYFICFFLTDTSVYIHI